MSPRRADATPRLIADIGPSHAHFALQTAWGELTHIEVLTCREHNGMEDAIRAYLASVDAPLIAHAAIGIDKQVCGDLVQMTEPHWDFSIEATRQALGLVTLLLVNRIGALVRSIPQQALVQIGAGVAQPGAPRALLGTELGVPAVDMIALADAYGHVRFTRFDKSSDHILLQAKRNFDHVSFEQLLSGQGLELIYAALGRQAGNSTPALSAAEIIVRSSAYLHSRAALHQYCAMLASVSASIALTQGARGGVYIGNGIAPVLGAHSADSLLRTRSEGEGHLLSNLTGIPVYMITSARPALVGAAAALAEHLELHDRRTLTL